MSTFFGAGPVKNLVQAGALGFSRNLRKNWLIWYNLRPVEGKKFG